VFTSETILINNKYMNTAQIIAKARRQAHTNATSYTDADAIIDLNDVYQDIIWDIVTYIDEDYFWDKSTVTPPIWQSEYPILEIWVWANAKKILQVNKVFIKYSATDAYYTKVTRVNPTQLTKDTQYYADNQNPANPFYYIEDDSLFIFPTPTQTVTNWLEIFVITEPPALDINSLEADIILPKRFHDLIAIWLKQYIFGQFKQLNEKNDAYNEYISKKKLMLKQMRNRDQWEISITTPNLLNFQ